MMSMAHSKYAWHRLSRFPSRNSFQVPYAYVFQKSKSAIKNRLIVSYWVHPLKRIYNYGSRALALSLIHISEPTRPY